MTHPHASRPAGFADTDSAALRDALLPLPDRSTGARTVALCGLTGSGKSTTLGERQEIMYP